MDIVNEIDRLPQYYYMLKNGEIILGGNTGNYDEKANEHRSSTGRLYRFWKEIKDYYERDGEKEILTVEEKREYAQMVYKMMKHSEGRKIERKELKEIIDKLSEEDKKEIEWQIDMYKRGRRYCGQYVRNR